MSQMAYTTNTFEAYLANILIINLLIDIKNVTLAFKLNFLNQL